MLRLRHEADAGLLGEVQRGLRDQRLGVARPRDRVLRATAEAIRRALAGKPPARKRGREQEQREPAQRLTRAAAPTPDSVPRLQATPTATPQATPAPAPTPAPTPSATPAPGSAPSDEQLLDYLFGKDTG